MQLLHSRQNSLVGRREFIGWMMRLALVLPASASALPARAGRPSRTVPSIVVVRGDRIAALRKALEALGGMKRFVSKGNKVLLKPNMSFPNPPEWATGTHPDTVSEVARMCLEAGAKRVLVIDHPLRHDRLVLDKTGIRKACKGLKDVYVFASSKRSFYRKVRIPRGKVLKRTEVVKDLFKSDVFINLPTAKSHAETGVSLGIKNLMGLIWDRRYLHQYIDLNQAIADLASSLRPDLTIMDVTRALVTSGPSGPGKVVSLNTIVAGVDPVAVDAYTVGLTRWYGRNFIAKEVRHLLAAHRMGLGEIEVSRMSVKEIRA